MTLFHKLFREWRGKRALAQIVAQSAASYRVQRYTAGRKAALKNRPERLKRIPYAWKRERADG